jgi:hypothetical protein
VRSERGEARAAQRSHRRTWPSPSRIEHIARIGQHLGSRWSLLKVAGRQTPASTELHVEVHLDVENRRQAGRGFAHIGQLRQFVDCERVGACKLDEE